MFEKLALCRSVLAGRDIVVGDKKTTILKSSDEVPELLFHLDAGPTKPTRVYVENRSKSTLVITSFDIAGKITHLDRRVTTHTTLAGLNFPESLIENKNADIKLKVRYETLSGVSYEYSEDVVQESRTDDKFNVSLKGKQTQKKIK